MADTVAKQIINACFARLQAVQVANGFNTDAGLRVYRGRRTFDFEGDYPVFSVWSPENTPADNRHNERHDLTLSVVVEGHALADLDNPNDAAQDLLGDIKQALFLAADRTMGNLVADLRWTAEATEVPEDGGQVVSVRVFAEASYPELYGDPYTVL